MINDTRFLSERVQKVQLLLKYTYGLVPIVAGADKFFNILTNWSLYLNPLVANLVPSPSYIMYAVGVIEIIAGCIVLSKYTKIGAYIVSLWLTLVALNLITMGMYFDIAVRDLVMAVGAFALALLS